MGQGTIGEVRNGSGDPRRRLGWVGGPSGKSGTGRGTLVEVRDGWGNLGEDLDGWLDNQGGSGRVGGPSERFGTGGGPSGRSWIVR